MSNPLRDLERQFVMLRHIPPGRVARRFELNMRRRLAPHLAGWLETGAAPALAQQPPLPILPPRPLIEPWTDGWRFWQPWGSMDLPSRIDWRLPGSDARTASWRVNLHYMEFLETVDDAAFVAIITDWIAENPLHAGDSWRCAWWSYNLAIRVVVWMQQLALRRSRLPDAFIAKATLSLARQLRFLERHLETDLRGNHLIRNLKALLWAGAFFTGPEAERWRRTGMAFLKSELAWQFLADGCHYELSPSYHCQVMGDLLEVASVLGPGPLKDELLASLDHMARVVLLFTHPDGKVALLNDGGLDMAYLPAQLLAAHAAMDRSPPVVPEGPFVLSAAGFFGLRSNDEYFVVDCGPIGPDELIGHGHGDILSFEWSVGGRRLVVDQGTYQHDAGPRRVQSRSTASHNTVSIDDTDMCDFFGAHRCGRRAKPTVLVHRLTATGFQLKGTHDGFANLPGQPRHVRWLEAAPGRVTLSDRIEGAGSHRAMAGLLLHPDCRAVLVDGGAVVTNGPVVVRIESEAPLVLEPAEWFPNLYTTLPTWRLRYGFASADGEQVVTLVAR